MVSRKTRQRKTLSSTELFLIFLSLMVISMFLVLAIVLHSTILKGEETNPISQDSDIPVPEKTEVETPSYKKYDFQPIIDQWVSQTGGNKSVIVYDLERDELIGTYNLEAYYPTASLYKLFVVYEGYLKIDSGEWEKDARAGGTGYSIIECLDLAIRESNSVCAETIWNMIGRDELDKITANDFLIDATTPSQLSSNVQDIAKMLKIYYWHRDIKDTALINQMKDSFLNQPTTEYNWRQGLPSGFKQANVYNKVGWDYNPDSKYWNVYHDAAIVEFPEDNRHFIVVVMTSHVPFQQIKQLGTMLEEAY